MVFFFVVVLFFWQGDAAKRGRHAAKRSGTWGRWNVNHAAQRTCATKADDGKHMSRLALIYRGVPNHPARLKRGEAKVEPFGVSPL